MKSIDLTHEIYNKMPVYPGAPELNIEKFSTVENNGSNQLLLHILTHHGTHLDAPHHIIEDGETIDHFPINNINSKCIIIKINNKNSDDKIYGSDLTQYSEILKDYESIIFNTGWSNKRGRDNSLYANHWVGLSEDASLFLSNFKLKIIGIDGLSIAPPPTNASKSEIINIHKNILKNNTFIVEELNLNDNLFYDSRTIGGTLTVMPLKIRGGDGSPVRVIFTY